MITYHSTVRVSFRYMRKTLALILSIIVIVEILMITLLPAPVNSIFPALFGAACLVMSIIASILYWVVPGVTVSLEDGVVRIKSSPLSSDAPENEIHYTPQLQGICTVLTQNIIEARPLTRQEDEAIARMNKTQVTVRVGIVSKVVNYEEMRKLAFICDWGNIVKLRLKDVKLGAPTLTDWKATRLEKEYELLVSVQDAAAFCRALKVSTPF